MGLLLRRLMLAGAGQLVEPLQLDCRPRQPLPQQWPEQQQTHGREAKPVAITKGAGVRQARVPERGEYGMLAAHSPEVI